MKTCRNCQKPIPRRITIDGKLRNLCSRKFCFECSPFGSRNTKSNLTPETAIIKEDKKKLKNLMGVRAITLKRQKRKEELVAMKGGKCQICGYDKCLSALHFHHRDPSTKTLELNKGTLNTYKWSRILEESHKCDLICSNCHAEEHDRLKNEVSGAGVEPAMPYGDRLKVCSTASCGSQK